MVTPTHQHTRPLTPSPPRTHRKEETFARAADHLGFVKEADFFEAMKAIIAVQRDHGNREACSNYTAILLHHETTILLYYYTIILPYYEYTTILLYDYTIILRIYYDTSWLRSAEVRVCSMYLYGAVCCGAVR